MIILRLNFNKKDGDVRIKTKFLILPKIINGELRWLEFATYSQEYSILGCGVAGWFDIEWIG